MRILAIVLVLSLGSAVMAEQLTDCEVCMRDCVGVDSSLVANQLADKLEYCINETCADRCNANDKLLINFIIEYLKMVNHQPSNILDAESKLPLIRNQSE